jgi:hypothetical protein
MIIEYSSNNSGGPWWLKDEDWKALEAAGWHVMWGGEYFCGAEPAYTLFKRPADKPTPCASRELCPGHRRFDSWQEMTDNDRWLRALAKEASKDFSAPVDAMREFERVTGQDVMDEGCNCCGAPHAFKWGKGETWGYASGQDCSEYLFGADRPKTLREALERG